MEPFHNPLRVGKVGFACISVSLVFVCFLDICLVLFEFICAIGLLRSCMAALAVVLVLFFFSFTSLYNTVINPGHNYNWFANRLWLHFYCSDVRD